MLKQTYISPLSSHNAAREETLGKGWVFFFLFPPPPPPPFRVPSWLSHLPHSFASGLRV